MRSTLKRPIVGRAGAHRGRQASHGFEVVIENVRLGGEHGVDGMRRESLKSGVSTSMTMSGIQRRAPLDRLRGNVPRRRPSGRRARRPVMTTCRSRIRCVASATRAGSSASSANGLAVVTAQKPQARVQRSPPIMNVAVPLLQHSQWFGHFGALANRVQLEFIQQRTRVREGIGRRAGGCAAIPAGAGGESLNR